VARKTGTNALKSVFIILSEKLHLLLA